MNKGEETKVMIAREMLLGGVITKVELEPSTSLIAINVLNHNTNYRMYPNAVSRISGENNKELSIDRAIKKAEDKTLKD